MKVKFLIFINFFLHGQYKSQYGQDKFLNENYFFGKKNGVFVDIGAHDGIELSNTYFFEKALGWTGVCVEPLPDVFAKLKSNRDCVCLNCCVSTKEGWQPFLQVIGRVDVLSGLLHTYHPKHLERLKLEFASSGGSYKIVDMFCRQLNEILKENKFKRIDYLSIDIEGGEFDILQSIDYDQFKVYAISIEDNYGEIRTKKFLESKGFKLVKHLGVDDIYINSLNV